MNFILNFFFLKKKKKRKKENRSTSLWERYRWKTLFFVDVLINWQLTEIGLPNYLMHRGQLRNLLRQHRINIGSGSTPDYSFGWEHKVRHSLCTHDFHSSDSKDGIFVLDGRKSAAKTYPASTVHENRMWLPLHFDWIKTSRQTSKYTEMNKGESHTQKANLQWWLPEI